MLDLVTCNKHWRNMTCRVMITFVLKIRMEHVLPKCSSSGLRFLGMPISCSCSAILPLRLRSTLLLMLLHPLPLYPYLMDSLIFNTHSEVSNLHWYFSSFPRYFFYFFTVESRVNGDGHSLRVLIPIGRLCPSLAWLTNFDKIWFWSLYWSCEANVIVVHVWAAKISKIAKIALGKHAYSKQTTCWGLGYSGVLLTW